MAVTPLAVVLMLMKLSLHTHPYPDLLPVDLTAVLGRTPVWALAGLAVGLGAGLAAMAFAAPWDFG
jgi:hypothetical protein